jgi:hypothetical protein
MKRNTKIAALLFCFALEAHASNSGGSLVGNGAGLAELEITYAYTRLPESIRRCFSDDACDAKLSDRERDILKQIRVQVLSQNDAEQKIHYVSEKELPGFFTTGEGEFHRIAKTDTRTYSIIFINTDAIYGNGKALVDAPLATSLLIHELGHQLGVADHTWLNILGSKVRAAIENTKTTVEYPRNNNLTMTVYSGANSIRLFLNNALSSVDLTNRVEAALVCPEETSLVKAFVINPHWNLAQHTIPYQFNAFVRYQCVSSTGLFYSLLVDVTFNIPMLAAESKEKLAAQKIGFLFLKSK